MIGEIRQGERGDPELHVAVVDGSLRGQTPVLRRALSVNAPALEQTFLPGVAWEWQWDAANMNAVPDSVLRAASRVKVSIPMPGRFESLNAAAATAVCLFECVRQRTRVPGRDKKP